jgi:D-alanyl-lipoteichoic acid acyltransferase DltB (MBOAT superfamily)
MLLLAVSLAVVFFVQLYWLVGGTKQNQFLLLGFLLFGFALLPATMTIAIVLSSFVYAVLLKGGRLPAAMIAVVCLLPLVANKLFPAVFARVNLMGLSYFSFLLLGVFIDLRRTPVEGLMRPSNFFSLVAFVPILPIGPIERVGNLGRQLLVPRKWQWSHFTTGVLLIAFGIFKKVVIADRLSELAVDSGRDSLEYYGARMWAFSLLSLLQIFADFSSIVDIVRGLARLLGFNIIDNFDRPYMSDSIQDIWRRWHISLVSWLRDFVYTPIALKTRSVLAASAVVMLIIGMWHEASWRFALWSAYWISVFWIAVMLRKNGIRIHLPALPKRLAMICVMAISTIFMLPTSFDELVIFAGNFFRFSGAVSRELNVSTMNLSIALLGFAVVIGLDQVSDKLKFSFRTPSGGVESRGFHLVSLLTAFLLLTLSVALAAGSWEKFVYLRY